MRVLPVVVCAMCLALVGCDEKREKVAEFVSPDGGHVATVYAGHYNVTVRDSMFVYVEEVESGLEVDVLLLEAEEAREQVAGEGADCHVVVAHDAVVTLAFDGDPILRTFQLSLKIAEASVRLKLGVIF